jgi:hypothetical protein
MILGHLCQARSAAEFSLADCHTLDEARQRIEAFYKEVDGDK